jgi:hypothetical protein
MLERCDGPAEHDTMHEVRMLYGLSCLHLSAYLRTSENVEL